MTGRGWSKEQTVLLWNPIKAAF